MDLLHLEEKTRIDHLFGALRNDTFVRSGALICSSSFRLTLGFTSSLIVIRLVLELKAIRNPVSSSAMFACILAVTHSYIYSVACQRQAEVLVDIDRKTCELLVCQTSPVSQLQN